MDTKQPQAQAPMQAPVLMQTETVQPWHNLGTDCCSPPATFFFAYCLPCVVYGRIHHRLHKDGQLKGWSFINRDCCGWLCLTMCCCQWIIQMMQRGEIEKKYGLESNCCINCLCAYIVSPCDLAQQDKETEFRENQLTGLVTVQPDRVDAMQYGKY